MARNPLWPAAEKFLKSYEGNTLSTYTTAMRQWGKWHEASGLGEPIPSSTTMEHMVGFARSLEARDLAESSVALKVGVVVSFIESVLGIPRPDLRVRHWASDGDAGRSLISKHWWEEVPPDDGFLCQKCGRVRAFEKLGLADEPSQEWCDECENRWAEIRFNIEEGPSPKHYGRERFEGPPLSDQADGRDARAAAEHDRAEREAAAFKARHQRHQRALVRHEDATQQHTVEMTAWKESHRLHTRLAGALGLASLFAWFVMSLFVAALATAVAANSAEIGNARLIGFAAMTGWMALWFVKIADVVEKWGLNRSVHSDPGPASTAPVPPQLDLPKRPRPAPRQKPAATGPVGLSWDRWLQICEFFQGCAYCGKKRRRPEEYQIEHVRPRSKGGDHSIENVVPACVDCNLWKSSMTGAFYVHQRERTRQHVNPKWYEWAALNDKSTIWRSSNH